MRLIFRRGPSLRLRLIVAVIFAISIIITDSRFSIFNYVRSYMDITISSFYFILDIPREFFDNIFKMLSSHNQLKIENNILRKELLLKNAELLMLEQYRQENERLRNLLNSPLFQDEYKVVTKVISTINDYYSNQVVIDKGSINGVYEGQPVISDKGVVGQVIAVSKFTSRVLLICDTAHALPIQVLRNGIRVVAIGNGCPSDELKLEYLPINSDIRVGDILITSGLGGRFPEGYPVAIVSSIRLNRQHSCITIQARPIAKLKHLRYLLLLWTINQGGNQSMTPKK